MNDKNRQRHLAYEALVILGQLALLTFITRLWPILLLIILGIFVAALRLLFLSSKKVLIAKSNVFSFSFSQFHRLRCPFPCCYL